MDREIVVQSLDFGRETVVKIAWKLDGHLGDSFEFFLGDWEEISDLILRIKSSVDFLKSKNSHGKFSTPDVGEIIPMECFICDIPTTGRRDGTPVCYMCRG